MTNRFSCLFFSCMMTGFTLITFTSVSIFSIIFSINISLCTEKGKLIEQSKLPGLAIISFILIILMNDSSVILEAGHCQGLKG